MSVGVLLRNEYTDREVSVAVCFLQDLKYITTQILDLNNTVLLQVTLHSLDVCRCYYGGHPAYAEFVHSLNEYIDALYKDDKQTSLEISKKIMFQSTKVWSPAHSVVLPWYISFILLLTGCFAVVALALVAASGPLDVKLILSVVFSALSIATVVALFPVTHRALRTSAGLSSQAVTQEVTRILSFSPRTDSGSEHSNPFSEMDVPREADRDLIERHDVFLADNDAVMKHRKSLNALLQEATEDDSYITVRAKGLPPASVGTSAIYRHAIVVVTDLEGQIVLWSEGASAYSGFSARDAEGNNITTLLSGDKTIDQYAKMTEAAEKGLDMAEKTLALAHLTLGTISVHASVMMMRNVGNGEPVGFALFGSVHSDDLARAQSVLHKFFVAQLDALNNKDSQYRQIVNCLQWKNLRDLSSATRDWTSTHIRRVLSEAIKGHNRQVDVEIDQQITEMPQVLCDPLGMTSILTRLMELFPNKIHLRVDQKRTTDVVRTLVVTFQYETTPNKELLQSITESANDMGGLIVDSPGFLRVHLPFLMKDEVDQTARNQGNAVAQGEEHEPLIVLLLEKNAVYRHNISSLIWGYGHSLRIVENVRKAIQAVEESKDIGCAIIDADIRSADRVVDALVSKRIFAIEVSEAPETVAKRGDAILKKPVADSDLLDALSLATERVEEAKKADEELTKRREVFNKVRNSPWSRGRCLGRGAFAEVYEATSTLTGGKMAVKMIRIPGNFEERVADLMNEIEILCKLSHPNIIHYFYCESTESTLNLFMELAEQGTVADLLQKCPRLPEKHLATVMKQLLQAVNYLHDAEISHRDIKPANMLVSHGKMKLSDFGTATTSGGEGIVGTLFYMAPEVVDGKTSGKMSDIWSIGCVACECLQIRREGGLMGYDAPKAYPDYASPAVVDFIKACMHEDPTERATAGTLLLHDFIVGLEHEVTDIGEVLPEAMVKPKDTSGGKGANDGGSSPLSVSSAPSWSFD